MRIPHLRSVLARGHGLGVLQGLVRRTAGIWGPTVFCGAAVLAARRKPGYSHRSHHISGLAARGERSARVMVPGFLVLGLSSSVMPAPTETVRRLARAAGFATVAAGLVQPSAPSCPQPFLDPDATVSDVGHGVASVATFALWTAMPVTAFRQCEPGWFRSLSGALSIWTVTGFVAAGATDDCPVRPQGAGPTGLSRCSRRLVRRDRDRGACGGLTRIARQTVDHMCTIEQEIPIESCHPHSDFVRL